MQKARTKNKNKRYTIFVVVAISVILAGAFSIFGANTVNKAIYHERTTSLNQLINMAARSINDHVEAQWEIARVYESDIEVHINQYDTLEGYLAYLNSLLSTEGDYYFLVDSVGKYYCSDGVNGKIKSQYFTDGTVKELEYLDTLPHFTDGTTYLILRTCLDEPVHINSVNGDVEIKYCALVHNLSSVVDHINNLFDTNNNTIVFDRETGLMLYKQFGIRLLMDGYNVYDKYKRASLYYGEDGNQIIEAIKEKQSSISMMEVEKEQYYLCSAPLTISDWSLLLVVDASYFDSNTDHEFGKVISAITLLLSIAALLVIALFWYFSKLKVHKKLLENEQEVNEALNSAYQMKSNFLSYMSHDIRTPINGMIGMANIGLNNCTDTERVCECFHKIDLSSKHLLAIVNDVLDMSAIESGKIVISNEKMDLTATLGSCLDIIKGTLNNRDLKLIEDYQCPIHRVLGDEFHLKQIVINILSNAVKFTEDGGTIRVSCKQLGEQDGRISYEIAISDTGCGMTEEFKAHIFEAFKTAKPDGKTKYKGSGLGMAISHEYVRLMQGTIRVDSEVNAGSTFTIVLPFGKTEQEDERTADAKELKDCQILLVDDNEINQEIAKEMLIEEVRSIRVANDGKEAVEVFTSSDVHEFDIILMDIQMPVMNGYEAAQAIRASQRPDSNICIIALTANTYKDDIDAIFEAGMNGYLNKPFSVEQLLEKLGKGDMKA